MASSRDVRDMLGLAAANGQKPVVQKKPKPAATQRKFQGVAREVAALYGERPPPVAVYEEKKSYRAKRQNAGPAKKWIQQPFTNPARTDGLVLKHWRRKPGPRINPENGEDISMVDGDAENQGPQIETQYDFAKYNVQVDMPTYTDEDYEAYLKSDDWSKEETEYLLDLIKEYYHRWAVIIDRYDFRPTATSEPASQEATNGDSQALATLPFAPPKARTMEDLKARFYDISAKLMKLRIPEVQMDADQYALYETLTKFDPHLERNRKALAAALMNRSLDEVKEEEFLLTELQRINMAANRLDAERAELRERLEAPPTNQSLAGGMAQFQSSQALTALFSQLFQQDRSKKRQSTSGGRLSLSATDIIGTPTSANPHLGGSAARRQSMAQQAQAQQPIKSLNPADEHRFNVSTHDRLTSGVTFGSDKLLKMRQAKSNVQTQKIATLLAQFGVSELIPIPTNKVGEVFERLIAQIGKLLDVRKTREREENEMRIMEQMKGALSGEGGGEARKQDEGGEVKMEEEGEGEDGNEEPEEDEENQDEDNMDDTEMADVDEDAEQDAEGEDDEDAEGADEDPEIDAEEDADADADGDPDLDIDPDMEDEDEDEDAEGEEDSRSQSIRQPSEAVSTRTGGVAPGHKRSASVLSATSNKSSKRRR